MHQLEMLGRGPGAGGVPLGQGIEGQGGTKTRGLSDEGGLQSPSPWVGAGSLCCRVWGHVPNTGRVGRALGLPLSLLPAIDTRPSARGHLWPLWGLRWPPGEADGWGAATYRQ